MCLFFCNLSVCLLFGLAASDFIHAHSWNTTGLSRVFFSSEVLEAESSALRPRKEWGQIESGEMRLLSEPQNRTRNKLSIPIAQPLVHIDSYPWDVDHALETNVVLWSARRLMFLVLRKNFSVSPDPCSKCNYFPAHTVNSTYSWAVLLLSELDVHDWIR